MYKRQWLGWKHFIYLGETGEDEDIFSELCHKYIGKPYRRFKAKGTPDYFAMSDEEAIQAELWVNEHFYLMPSINDFTIEKFYDNVSDIENQFNVKFDTTLIDPVGDIQGFKYDLEYLAQKLKYVRRTSKKYNRICLLYTSPSPRDRS